MQSAMDELGGDVSASHTGIMIAGLTYVIIALISTKFGTDWIDHLLPPIVIGPMIMVIGLGLSSSAVENAGLVSDAEWRTIVVALSTFLITAFVNTKATGFLRIIPFLVGIIGGYIIALLLGVVDVTPIIEADWFSLPELRSEERRVGKEYKCKRSS